VESINKERIKSVLKQFLRILGKEELAARITEYSLAHSVPDTEGKLIFSTTQFSNSPFLIREILAPAYLRRAFRRLLQ
jgi:hypothetical protein